MQEDQERSSKINSCVIELTRDDPIERLAQLCTQGMYDYKFTWDKFANGIMCELEITQTTGRILVKEVRYTNTTDEHQAQEIVAAILLEKLGLGVPEEELPALEEVDETEVKLQQMASKGLEFAFTTLDKLMGGMGGSDNKQ